MAEARLDAVAHRVSFYHHHYTGSNAALRAAGIVSEGVPFPGERPPSVAKNKPYTFTNGAGQECRILRAGRGQFEVRVPISQEEYDDAAAREAAAKARTVKREAAGRARATLAKLEQTSPTEWQEDAAGLLQRLAGAVLADLAGEYGRGFRLAAADLEAVRLAVDGVADRIRSARVHTDRAALAEKRRKLLATCAAADDGLQGFLAAQGALATMLGAAGASGPTPDEQRPGPEGG